MPKDDALHIPSILLGSHAEHRAWLASANRETGLLPVVSAQIAADCQELGFVVRTSAGWVLSQDGRGMVSELDGSRIQ
jgi:hypothetical protein